MPVPVGVIALAENVPVLLRGELRIVVVVRGGEFSFAGEIEQAAFSFKNGDECTRRARQGMRLRQPTAEVV